ncbi:hypothetical protein UAY_00836 [Enterococcus moraviensis ATCC BAA-383]|uniref:DUF3013 family protein n=1 Tax=Enterococcus moraviensis ATCC BAA-383 TaxID=1158609 RepID=R2TDM6_9ENTE|nr:DUF3013 family protein [Enterococcus moraviensis]EOI03089.1 hypothetical protein UAY_00836 [Enterococcus moraviensis ATCC BAA-383]EOT74034.1 hypothetical protein I586_01030 [Enterococcus moraviensis ATCC BAA-383]
MKKETMLTYLDQQITKKITEYDVALDWNTRNHSIEVVFRLFAENKTHEQIDDAAGTLSEEEIIEFEDGVLFYNPEKTSVEEEDYLAVIPYEGKKGIKKSVLDGFVAYLNEVLTEGQSDLLDFLTDEDQEVFELKWSNEEFEKAVQAYQKADSDVYIAYPSY